MLWFLGAYFRLGYYPHFYNGWYQAIQLIHIILLFQYPGIYYYILINPSSAGTVLLRQNVPFIMALDP